MSWNGEYYTINIKGQTYKLPKTNNTDEQLIKEYFNEQSFVNKRAFSLYGTLTPERKRLRHLINAIIKAKHKNSNHEEVITVKLQDRTVKINELKVQTK